MSSLTGTKIKDTYVGLLKTSDNGALGASAKQITDGLGTGSPIYVSTSGVGIGGSPNTELEVLGSGTGQAIQSDVSASFDADGLTKHTRLRISSSNTASSNGILEIRSRKSDSQWRSNAIANLNGEMVFLVSPTNSAEPTSSDERMRIDSSGNVDINGGGYLRVSPSTPPSIQIYRDVNLGNNASAGSLNFGGVDTSVFASGAAIGATTEGVWSSSSHPTRLYFATTASGSSTATERMRITSGGDLLFNGISSLPSASVHGGAYKSSGAVDGGYFSNSTDRTTTWSHFLFYNSNGNVGSISTSGSSTSYNTSSDYRLKEDWQPMADALTRIDALKPVNFAWKADGSRVDGFLAHELQEVIPEAVTGEKDAMRDEEYEVSPAVYEDVVHPAVDEVLDEEGNILTPAQEEWTEKVLVSEAVMGTRSVPDYQGIDQSKIVPLLVAAIQELKAEVDALKGA